MARKITRRVRHCTVSAKRRFKNRGETLEAIAAMNYGGKSPTLYLCKRCGEHHVHRQEWSPYRCPDCNGWHLTSNKPRCTKEPV